jgi:hypothetical protein
MAEENPDLNVHEYKLRNHEERLDKIDLILEKVRNRLPNWATFTFGVLLLVIGWLIKGVIK